MMTLVPLRKYKQQRAATAHLLSQSRASGNLRISNQMVTQLQEGERSDPSHRSKSWLPAQEAVRVLEQWRRSENLVALPSESEDCLGVH